MDSCGYIIEISIAPTVTGSKGRINSNWFLGALRSKHEISISFWAELKNGKIIGLIQLVGYGGNEEINWEKKHGRALGNMERDREDWEGGEEGTQFSNGS